MDKDSAEIVRKVWQLWAARDKAGTLRLFDDDILYALCIPEEVLPFGGETRGKASVADRLQTILNIFDTVRYEGSVTWVRDSLVHGNVDYCFRHKATGEELDGVLRIVARVENGRIVSWREATDAPRVHAFMRLVAETAAARVPPIDDGT